MRRHRFRPGDDAVSPVVGVVLLVGIAVMLTTSVGIFVLGFGPGEPTPETEIQFTQENDGNVTVTVVRPAGVQAENLDVRVNGSDACTKNHVGWGSSGGLDRSDRLTVYDCSTGGSLPTGTTVRVIWESSDGSRSEIVGEYQTV